jgi:transposase
MEKALKNQEKETQEKEVKATPGSGERLVREVRRKTRRRYLAEDKIRIVLEGFRKEIPVSELCRRENIPTPVYYSWLKDFMEGGKKRLQADTMRNATEKEIKELRHENEKMKVLLAELALENRVYKKTMKL